MGGVFGTAGGSAGLCRQTLPAAKRIIPRILHLGHEQSVEGFLYCFWNVSRILPIDNMNMEPSTTGGKSRVDGD